MHLEASAGSTTKFAAARPWASQSLSQQAGARWNRRRQIRAAVVSTDDGEYEVSKGRARQEDLDRGVAIVLGGNAEAAKRGAAPGQESALRSQHRRVRAPTRRLQSHAPGQLRSTNSTHAVADSLLDLSGLPGPCNCQSSVLG